MAGVSLADIADLRAARLDMGAITRVTEEYRDQQRIPFSRRYGGTSDLECDR
jgi:hypothetical protein